MRIKYIKYPLITLVCLFVILLVIQLTRVIHLTSGVNGEKTEKFNTSDFLSPIGVYEWDDVFYNKTIGECKLLINSDNSWEYIYTDYEKFQKENSNYISNQTGTWKKHKLILKNKFLKPSVPKQEVFIIEFDGDISGYLQYYKRYNTEKIQLGRHRPNSYMTSDLEKYPKFMDESSIFSSIGITSDKDVLSN